jgi:omega-6 fatty acid desaturase (delta-12 desaturase)
MSPPPPRASAVTRLSGLVPRPQIDVAAWKGIVARFQQPSMGRGIWQIVNTVVPYTLVWVAMFFSLSVSWWLTLPLAVLSGAFLVRIFIIFHDCGHGSFFASRKANEIVGSIAGVLTFTPYHHWRWEHALHHASSGNLDRRGTGDVWTMTVQEYLESSRSRRLAYRLARNPVVIFVLAPLYIFLIEQRFPSAGASRRERRSVHWLNLAIVGLAAALSALFGLKAYLLIQVTALTAAATSGVWLFYVQHQFDGVYWERGAAWDYTAAALEGSSFYKLPRIAQWFSGNIGFHHIHHLSPRIPNYNLERCHRADPLFQQVRAITLFASLKSLSLRLWDEQHGRLVAFRRLRELRRQGRQAAAG